MALDLYFRVSPLHTSEQHPDIVALSKLLNDLPLGIKVGDVQRYRNPNGVYMKLCNFLRLDPSYKGKGLTRGGHLEEAIWQEFSSDKDHLAAIARAIRSSSPEISLLDPDVCIIEQEDEEFDEGRILTVLHKRRERNPGLVAKKKSKVLNSLGRLECEVCGFDFAVQYGELGFGFAECHHVAPLCSLSAGQKTKLSDLSIICANCHRMIHRSKPMMSVEQMTGLIQRQGK